MARTSRSIAAALAIVVGIATGGELKTSASPRGGGQPPAPPPAQPPAQTPPAQQPPQQQPPTPPADPAQQPVFRTGINYVRVDVIVTDNKTGAPIGDLKMTDFDVTEDGKPQQIENFKLIKLDGGVGDATKEPIREIRTDLDEENEAAREDVRLFAMFLDDYHVRRGASMAVRGQLAQFVQNNLGIGRIVCRGNTLLTATHNVGWDRALGQCAGAMR